MPPRPPIPNHLWHLALRLGTAGLVAVVAVARLGFPAADPGADLLLGALCALALASALLPARADSPQRRALEMGVLVLHLLCVGGLVRLLLAQPEASIDPRIPFLAGYVVALLVAAVGQRPAHTVLGALAGGMVMALGLASLAATESLPASEIALLQFGLLAATAADAGWVSNAHRRERERQVLALQVERELKRRSADASEQATLVQALLDCSELREVADALLAHLRTHLEVQARAVVLEADGQEAAVWEEATRLDEDDSERRRVTLQAALREAGSQHLVARVALRFAGAHGAARGDRWRTEVSVPVLAGGRVAGVLLLADTTPGAVPPERIGVLADAARRVGEAIQRLERQRSVEQRRTALLLRQMREGILLLAPDGQVQMANPAAQQMLAASPGAPATGRPTHLGQLALADLARTPPGAARRFVTRLPDQAGAEARTLSGSALVLADGATCVGTLVTVADVTEEQATRRRVEHAEKMTLVGQTLAGVAHELNNPLAALLGYADLLRGQEMPATVRGPVDKMRDQALRATRIVRNVMDYARRRSPERHPVPLPEIARSVVELFAYEARIAGVELTSEVPEGLPPVLGDRHALQQVLVNLVQNALHALETYDGARAIRLHAFADGERVEVSVSDSGPGVPLDLRARIFLPFVTTKSPTRGTGLGLAISRSIAREHGGDLLLHPPSEGGATFTLRLPVARKAPAGAEAPAHAPERLGQHRILVVDDELSVRESLVAQLGYLGSDVDSAGSAAEAQRLLTGQRYDAVLLDLRMPGVGGIELHRDIAQRNPLMAQRVVYMTGDFVNGDLLEAVRSTGNPVLEKPFTIEELSRAVKAASQQDLLGAIRTTTA